MARRLATQQLSVTDYQSDLTIIGRITTYVGGEKLLLEVEVISSNDAATGLNLIEIEVGIEATYVATIELGGVGRFDAILETAQDAIARISGDSLVVAEPRGVLSLARHETDESAQV